jgi:hypothetical protein
MRNKLQSQCGKTLRTIPILCLIALTGCLGAKFQSDFSALAVQTTQPSDPLVGAWQGSWSSAAEGSSHVARAVVSSNSDGTYVVKLELSDFEATPGFSNFPNDKYWMELRDISLTSVSGATHQFQTKTRLLESDRCDLIAEAINLQGAINGASLQIQFSTNDALNELDHGQIELYRVECAISTHCGTRQAVFSTQPASIQRSRKTYWDTATST